MIAIPQLYSVSEREYKTILNVFKGIAIAGATATAVARQCTRAHGPGVLQSGAASDKQCCGTRNSTSTIPQPI